MCCQLYRLGGAETLATMKDPMKSIRRWFTGVQDALHRVEQAIDDLLDSLPNRLVVGVMLGSSSDRRHHAVG